ncbi:putative MFS family arabinose efflux permease [Tumebacillus sp. BK434]|uniref:MFS transporter n=1 Tax=Tumebacillus sp. BK434 TaxID=2512169 RepID=UPI00104BC95A|nr:MFS transporter [Tumebacillus sp. BK434]TCP57606.1 putative MFS family arabinose efflux permease [Tumebacillus sp. BK434]
MSEQERAVEHNPPLWTKDFFATAVSNLFLFLGFQMLIPTLPVYVSSMGGDETQIGLVIGIFTISALLIRPFAGQWLDTMGRRKILLAGLLIYILSVIGYAFAAAVTLVLLLRVVHGLGWGMTTTSYGTIVADIIPPKRRGEGMGYYGLSGNLAMALAPLLGIWVMEEYGFGWVFGISTGLAVLALLLTQLITIAPPVKREAAGKAPAKKEGLFERKAFFPSFLVLFLAISYGGIVSFITLFAQEAGIANVGWFFLANAAMVMLVRPFSGVLFDRKGHQWVLLPGAVFTAAGLLLLSYTHSVAMLIAAAVCYGIGFGAIQPSLQAWTINRVPPHRRGAANGTYFSAFDLGIGAGAMLLGAVAKVTSYALMYRLSVLLVVGYVLAYVVYMLRERKVEKA